MADQCVCNPWEGNVRLNPDLRGGCDDVAMRANPARFARRSLLRAAVLGHRGAEAEIEAAFASLLRPQPVALRAVLTGTVADAGPHSLVVHAREGEQQLVLTQATTAWRGGPVSPASLRRGDEVILRKTVSPGHVASRNSAFPKDTVFPRNTVERVWAGIGRATGVILEAWPTSPRSSTSSPTGLELLVDEGPARPRRVVVIAREMYRQILVRFPRLEPGYLIDVIGRHGDGFLRALAPATSQPAYRADHPPATPMVSGRIPNPVSGAVVWHEPGEEPAGLLGLAYPAVDPETGCEHSEARQALQDDRVIDPHEVGPGCVRLPYLSVGSVLSVRNDCTGLSVPLPVTSCGASARLFCDRCVECSTSARGRIADLTMAAFVELGGLLDRGCFNASLAFPGYPGFPG
jgi:hypothetical protein